MPAWAWALIGGLAGAVVGVVIGWFSFGPAAPIVVTAAGKEFPSEAGKEFPSESPGSAPSRPLFPLQVSDCLDEPEGYEGVLAEGGEAGDVSLVPCSEPHDSEVYATFELPEGEYPGDEEIHIVADDRCFEEFDAFVGLSFDASVLDFYAYIPTQRTWRDSRVVMCVVFEPLTQSTGTLRDAAR